MRLVIAQCTVDYVGRLTAHLPSARRLLLVKADGSVSVHADDRAYKPLNWMSPPCWLTEEPDPCSARVSHAAPPTPSLPIGQMAVMVVSTTTGTTLGTAL